MTAGRSPRRRTTVALLPVTMTMSSPPPRARRICEATRRRSRRPAAQPSPGGASSRGGASSERDSEPDPGPSSQHSLGSFSAEGSGGAGLGGPLRCFATARKSACHASNTYQTCHVFVMFVCKAIRRFRSSTNRCARNLVYRTPPPQTPDTPVWLWLRDVRARAARASKPLASGLTPRRRLPPPPLPPPPPASASSSSPPCGSR